MLRRVLFLLLLAVLMGCSGGSDVTGVTPQSKSEAEKKQSTEGEPSGGVNKCAIYRTPPFCQLQ